MMSSGVGLEAAILSIAGGGYGIISEDFQKMIKQQKKGKKLEIALRDLMKKASNDMVKLSSLFEDADDVRASLTQMMWSNCKACHSKFRAPH